MAKIDISFNNQNYNVDESSLSTASAALASHLSTVMNGSGATINLGGTSYGVDSTKLSAATNDFISHLGTVAGNGYKVVVNGVEYNVDSAKMAGAVSDLHAVLGGLQSDSGSTDGVFDNSYPIEWNTKEVIGNPTVYFDGCPFVKISSMTPAQEELETLSVRTSKLDLPFNRFIDMGGIEDVVRVRFEATYNYTTTTCDLFVIYKAGNYAGIEVPEAGIYFLDEGSILNTNEDVVIDYTNGSGSI